MTVDLIAEYERHLLRLNRSPNTISSYISVLRRADREMPHGLVCADTKEMENWIFVEKHGKTTRHDYISIFRQWGKWATNPHDPWLDLNAAALLPDVQPTKTRPKPAPERIFHDILVRALDPFKLWYLIAGFAGLRCIELSRLDREDVTEEEISVFGKGDKERYVPTHPLIWSRVKDLPPGAICVDYDGKTRLTPQKVAHRGNHHIRKLGYPGTSMHTLRHRFASRAYDATKDIRAVQELLGHSSLGTTQRYVQVNRSRMTAAVQALPIPEHEEPAAA